MSTWVFSISLLTVIPTRLHAQAEQVTIILICTKMQIVMSNSINLILSRAVLETVCHSRFATVQDGAVCTMATVWSSYS